MSAAKRLNLTLKIWSQKNANAKGRLETYQLNDVSQDSSFLEMLDILNNELIEKLSVIDKLFETNAS